MLQKIKAYIKAHKMIEEQDRVIAACSGGADSVCQLFVLAACQKEFGFSLEAIHVEHGIRGEESLRDKDFTEELCRRLAIPLSVCAVDAPAYAAEHKMGLEEAARTLRYQAFLRLAKERGQQCGASHVKIALAHHMEDNAETVLFALVRGSGPAGLAGIAPVKAEGTCTFIRPLLCTTRAEIEAYLDGLKQPYCTDATNTDESYTRNRIRRSILPQLTGINAQAILHMNQCAEKIAEAYDFIRESAEITYRAIAVYPSEPSCGREVHLCLERKRLLALHPAVRGEVLRMALFEASGRRKDIASSHVKAMEELLPMQSGKRISLPYGLTAYTEYDSLHVCRLPRQKTDPATAEKGQVSEEILAEIMEDGFCRGNPAREHKAEAFSDDAWHIVWRSGNRGFLRARAWETSTPLEEITKKPYTKQFDYDKIKSGFLVRKRQPGDYFVMDENGHRKKLSDHLIDEKIPAGSRDSILLLAQGNEVIWIIGGRISAAYKVTKNTRRIMEIEFLDGGMSDGHQSAP